MLTSQQIADNKARFLSLVDSINIPGADIEGLKKFLEGSDFFTAPASTQYHCGYEGGLCQHSLNVYDNIVKLQNDMCPNMYSDESLKVVALFHDISKANFYEPYIRNKKVYAEKGKQKDNMGHFDWISEEAYKVKDVEKRYVCSDHPTNSFIMVSQYIPLMQEEISAIINHHGGFNVSPQDYDISSIYNRYPLATLLMTADLLSCYITERDPNK